MLFGWIAADEQDRGNRGDVAQAGRLFFVACERAREGRIVRSAVVVDVVGPKNRPSEFLKQVVLFVGGLIGANDGDG